MPKGSHLIGKPSHKRKNLVGQKFGKLFVMQSDGKKNNGITYKCLCDCGRTRENVITNNLTRGKTTSCGCDFPKNHCKSGLSKEEYFEHVRQSLISLRKIKNDCWEYVGHLNNKGYGFKTFGQGNAKRKQVVSRIAYILWKSEIPNGMFVLHKCDNPKCFNPEHLFLGTQKDNIQDMLSKNRCYRGYGSASKKAKLNEEQVMEVRKMREEGKTLSQIAEVFKVTDANISDICQRHTWRHI